MDDFEKRWKRMQQLLAAEVRGDAHPRVSSGRTLFGIRSSVEELMDQVAREDEEKYRRIRAEQRTREQQGQTRQEQQERE